MLTAGDGRGEGTGGVPGGQDSGGGEERQDTDPWGPACWARKPDHTRWWPSLWTSLAEATAELPCPPGHQAGSLLPRSRPQSHWPSPGSLHSARLPAHVADCPADLTPVYAVSTLFLFDSCHRLLDMWQIAAVIVTEPCCGSSSAQGTPHALPLSHCDVTVKGT